MAREHTILLLECLGCERAADLTAALMTSPGVTRVFVDTATEAVFVEHHTDRVSRAQLARVIERLGLRVRSMD